MKRASTISLVALTATCAFGQKAPKPNIILIMTDQQRFDCLGAVNDVVITPHLDSLASDGVLFTNGYTASPSSTPARSVLLTGMNPWNAGMIGYSNRVAEKYPVEMPRILADNGYHTVGVGKMHWWPQRNAHGFDTLIVDESGRVESDGFVSDYRMWFNKVAPHLNPDSTGIGWNSHLAAIYTLPETLHPSYWTANEAIAQINNDRGSKPLFLKVSFARPHSPYDPPAKYFDMYKDAQIEAPWVGDWCGGYADRGQGDNDAPYGDFGAAHAINSRRHYYASMTFIDEQIGRIIAQLKAQGLYDNSIIIFTSDHGDMMGDHHHWRKTYAYEGSTHIPFIIKVPRQSVKGATMSQCVGLEDILPTFLDAASVPIPSSIDGASILPITKSKKAPWRQYIASEHSSCYEPQSGWVALTDGVVKYIWNYNKGTQMLFDLKSDPKELHNAANDAKQSATIAIWRERMAKYLQVRGEEWVKNGALQIVKSEKAINNNYPSSK